MPSTKCGIGVVSVSKVSLAAQTMTGKHGREHQKMPALTPRTKGCVHWQTARVASCCSSRLAAWCTS